MTPRIYRWLLYAYPAEFRAEYAREMALLYEERAQAEPASSLWFDLLKDVLKTAPKEHWHIMWNDLIYATRMLRKTPVVTVAAILTLALGIGANTAMFSVTHGVILRALPFDHSERLVRLWERNDKLNFPFFSFSLPNLVSVREQNKSFAELAAWRQGTVNAVMGEETERLSVGMITPNTLSMLALKPAIGRDFLQAEERPGSSPVVLLGYSLWKNRFAGDPNVIGRQLNASGASLTIVGVGPREVSLIGNADLYMPLVIDLSRENRANHTTAVAGRLKPGVTPQQAEAELKAIAAGLGQQFPDSNKDWTMRLATFYDWLISPDLRRVLTVLIAAIGAVLLIACANVANLMLARAAAREKEIAVRAALGAKAGRLVRQLLTESLLMAVMGGVAGVLLATWGIRAIKASPPSFLPRPENISMSPAVLWFTLAATIGTGILFGMIPAWQATKTDLQNALKETGRTSASVRRSMIRNGLVIAQVGMATVLLAGAGLLLQSFLRLQNVTFGFRSDHLLMAQFSMPGGTYVNEQKRWEFCRRLIEEMRAVPGVTSAAVSSLAPFQGGNTAQPMKPVGASALGPGEEISADWRMVSPGYFQAMQIPILRGREFTEHDLRDGPAVMIISQEMAQRLWPGEEAVGRQLKGGGSWTPTIIGVVGNVRNLQLTVEPNPAMYFSATQSIWPTMTILARTQGEPQALAPALRAKVREIDPALAVYNVRTMDERLDQQASQPRLFTILVAIFAGVAIALAAVGIYGVMAYSVSQRTREIGVRVALGAISADVLRMVVRQGMVIAACGLALGVAIAIALGETMTTLLYQVKPRDPATLGIVAVVVATVALTASYFPARRATAVDPLVALRHE
jgi:putative ABC transport system permease protein